MILTIATIYQDWEGLYVNGTLVYQHHEVELSELKYLLKDHLQEDGSMLIEDIIFVHADVQALMESKSRFPEKLEDVVLAKEENEDASCRCRKCDQVICSDRKED